MGVRCLIVSSYSRLGQAEGRAEPARRREGIDMAKKVRFDPTGFNFGANRRPKKGKGKKGGWGQEVERLARLHRRGRPQQRPPP
jgi:hypothetical protein